MVDGCARADGDWFSVVADLRDRPRSGLLHRHGVRDQDGRLREPGLGLFGGRYDSLASDGRTSYPGVGISLGVTRMLAAAARPQEADRISRVGATRRCWWRCVDEESPCSQQREWPRRCVPVAWPEEVSPKAQNLRQADPLRRPPRHPLRVVPRRGRTVANEIRDMRTGEQVAADPGGLDAICRPPAPAGGAARGLRPGWPGPRETMRASTTREENLCCARIRPGP